ncbi:MBL fold metallo-hydrolase [Alteromonas oceanisediminis]|uniref:MBL fold metallo-hydrolase n=1 Tax=Alteromonas oceanisediminis TaxID=2836180 RepID=UPI001BDA62E9|nr:MBL fold metallo-hydrolase [Alteromonas oceanisediminis]MBT0585404.1 MBL fold metallo-hydrolase [Alteromonas oceanisediminis]
MAINDLPLNPPEAGELRRINEHIFWLRMPLPFELDHINLYLLKDGDGYAAIDTGLGTKTTADLWQQVFTRYHIRLTRVFVTHMHPDHIGMAGALVEQFRAPLYMSHDEYYVARAIVAGRQGADPWQDRMFYTQCGLSEEYIENALSNKAGVAKVVKPIPLSFERLAAGMNVNIGDHDWQVIIGRGHSPEHVCLYSERLNILISGDHVLPQITPNIGVYSTEPNANALKQYLTTLTPFLDLPETVNVLPAHRQPFVGLHSRVRQLIAHHHDHFKALLAHCEEPRTLVECLPVLFKRTLNHQAMFFAVAECLSHLNYLLHEGSIHRRLADDGVYYYCCHALPSSSSISHPSERLNGKLVR